MNCLLLKFVWNEVGILKTNKKKRLHCARARARVYVFVRVCVGGGEANKDMSITIYKVTRIISLDPAIKTRLLK